MSSRQPVLTSSLPVFLKFALKNYLILALLLNRSFSLGSVPVQWKLANISPFHKANARDLVDNYRSISLVSIPGKCQERIVYSAIYYSAFLSDWQHGFVKGRSTASQLILTHHKWAKALGEGHQVDVVFLDFSKAFHRYFHFKLQQGDEETGVLFLYRRKLEKIKQKERSRLPAHITNIGMPIAKNMEWPSCLEYLVAASSFIGVKNNENDLKKN